MTAPLAVDPCTAAQWLREGAVLVDVREAEELAICQLAGARHVPMRDIPSRVGELPRDRPVLVLCHHGARSLQVTRFLRDQGFAQATNVAGGIDAWAREVDPTLERY
ncbi:MAG TPA: rhodanese-like domain-containing protein [Lacunisphaera sp.]|nr:rhodanese-like domain-containing protein [Lacunisphaera sp.]